MKQVAWGYVSSAKVTDRNILVGKCCKKDDPLRNGQLVIPGGGLLPGEDYTDTAIREVKEETGVATERYKAYIIGNFMPRRAYLPNLEADIWADGKVVLRYTDSHKKYEGRIISLSQYPEDQEPTEQPESDVREPQYIRLTEAIKRKGEFTPACQFLLELIKEREEV